MHHLLPLVIVAILAILGVFHRYYDDNLLQRIGLSLVGLGAMLKIYNIITNSPYPDQMFALIMWGAAIFGLGIAAKCFYYKGRA